MKLQTGFTSDRICHLCDGKEPCSSKVITRFSSLLFLIVYPDRKNITLSVLANSITMQLQEWWNLGPRGPLRTLEANVVVESPFWDDRKRSPLRDITPNGDDPKKILIDLAHTYAIQGWGKDDLASSIVFLSVRCGVWGTHVDYKSKLDRAWGSFKSWCVTNRKSTTITDFSPQCLKIQSYLVKIISA